MSSKLYEGGAGVNAELMVWRSGARTGAKPTVSFRADTPARDQRAGDPEEAARLQDEYNRGIAAGEAAGAQRATERLAPVFANLSAMIQELAGARRQVRIQAEAATVELAIAIARRVLHREVSTDPEALLGLVKSAGERLSAREIHRLRVASADAAAIQEHRARLNLPPGVEIIPDAQLTPGSAVFETARGELDASVGTQLDEIQRGLADLIRRSSSGGQR
jgi:flagellar assembly protein FliH